MTEFDLLLRKKMESADWDALDGMMERLTHSQKRRTVEIIRRQVLPMLDNDTFWQAYAHLVALRPQAFLSGVRAVARLASERRLDWDCEGAKRLAATIGHEQARKVADMALPLLVTEEQVEGMWARLGIEDERERLALLLGQETPLAYFLLLHTLQRLDHRRDLALRCCRFIMRRANDRALNMASILRTAFGLSEIDARLPLKLETYELAWIGSSFERFKHVLDGKKPNVR